MAHTASARKTVRQDKKRRLANKAVKSRLLTETKKLRSALEGGSLEEARAQLSRVTKLLHQAAAKKVIPANAAARRQMRLQELLNRAASGPSQSPPGTAPAA